MRMKRFLSVFTMMMSCIAGASAASSRSIMAEASFMPRAGLPTEEMAKTLLSAGLFYRPPKWIDIPAGSTAIRSFAVFPDGRDTAPVVVITANGQGAKRKRDSAQPQGAKRKRDSAQPQGAKRKRDSAQPQGAKRKRDSAQPQGMTDWLRAVGDQAAQEGFIA